MSSQSCGVPSTRVPSIAFGRASSTCVFHSLLLEGEVLGDPLEALPLGRLSRPAGQVTSKRSRLDLHLLCRLLELAHKTHRGAGWLLLCESRFVGCSR